MLQAVHVATAICGGLAVLAKVMPLGRRTAADFEKPKSSAMSNPESQKKRLFWLIRILYLSYYASTGSLVPYLPVYYRSLGHGGKIIGVLSSLRPLTNLLVGPLWAMLADYLQDAHLILCIAAIGSVLGYLIIGLQTDASSLIVCVIATSAFYSPVKSLMDSMVLERLSLVESSAASNNKSDKKSGTSEFGKLRLWGPIGFGLGCSIAGTVATRQVTIRPATDIPTKMIMDPSSESFAFSSVFQSMVLRWWYLFWNGMAGDKILFGIFALMSIPMMLTLLAFPRKPGPKRTNEQLQSSTEKQTLVENKDEARNTDNQQATKKAGFSLLVQGLSDLLQRKDTVLFFFLVFAMGVNMGAIETFCYVRMREVGATGQEIGFSRLLSAVAGTPMFWFSGSFTRLIKGDANCSAENRILLICLLSYAIRFLLYALIRSPMDALPAEAIRGITFAAYYSTASTYAHRNAPQGFKSSMLMIVNTLYGGLGQSIGSMVAGRIQDQLQTVQMFLVIFGADIALIGLVGLYLVFKANANMKQSANR